MIAGFDSGSLRLIFQEVVGWIPSVLSDYPLRPFVRGDFIKLLPERITVGHRPKKAVLTRQSFVMRDEAEVARQRSRSEKSCTPNANKRLANVLRDTVKQRG